MGSRGGDAGGEDKGMCVDKGVWGDVVGTSVRIRSDEDSRAKSPMGSR